MKKIKSIILVISLLFCINSSYPAQVYERVESQELSRMFNRVQDGIVFCYSGSSKTTGIFITKDGWVLTAGHKVDRDFPAANPIYVKLTRTTGAKVYKATKILPLAEGWDLLLFKIDYKPKFYFKGFEKSRPQQENWLFGFRMNSGKVVSGVGYISTDTKFPRLLLTTSPTISGNSGSPVLSRDGKVLGIITMAYTFGDGLFVPSSIVKVYIKLSKEEMKSND